MVVTIVDILNSPESDIVVNYTISRNRKGLYTLILVHGLPGTGKSSTCFRLAELIYAGKKGLKYTLKVITTLKDIAEFAMNSKAEELNIGIVEEISVLFPSRRAMASDNVELSKILDTCRKKKIILIANAPLWTGIDSHIRAMGNIYVETRKIYKSAKVVISKTYRLQTNPGTGKTYTHCFQRNGRDVARMYTRMPNLEVWSQYEKNKDDFMAKLYQKITLRASKREEKENKELGIIDKPQPNRTLTAKELDAYNLAIVQKLGVSETARRLGVSAPTICIRLKKIREKTNISFGKGAFSSNLGTTAPHKVSFGSQDSQLGTTNVVPKSNDVVPKSNDVVPKTEEEQ